MLANNALTTLDRMKLTLGLADITDGRVDEIVTLLINKAFCRRTRPRTARKRCPPTSKGLCGRSWRKPT
jgi:hypothetical protein